MPVAIQIKRAAADVDRRAVEMMNLAEMSIFKKQEPIMNRTFAIAATVLAATVATNALADDITVDKTPFNSSRSRAEVLSEFAQFKQSGVNPHSSSYNPLRSFRSEKTRAQVEQEFLGTREQAHAVTGEDSGSAYFAKRAS